MDIDVQLIRERCNYYQLPINIPEIWKRESIFNWSFEDTCNNGFGRFYYSAENGDRIDVFGREVYLSKFACGERCAATVISDGSGFSLQIMVPPTPPVSIYQQEEEMVVAGISCDDRFVLVEAAQDNNAFRRSLLVFSVAGEELARLDAFEGITGCSDGHWAPDGEGYRILFHHEFRGRYEPAIWWSFENRTQPIHLQLKGEIKAKWDRKGSSLLIWRTLDGKSDLYRYGLEEETLEEIQPLDGSIRTWDVNSENQAVGVWSGSSRFFEIYQENERVRLESFVPTVPLTSLRFRRISGIPCFMAGEFEEGQSVVFFVYGSFGYHYCDRYFEEVQVLVDHGFSVVLVNTRGCNGFGRQWRIATLENIGFSELEDLELVRETLISESLVDGDRTIVAGSSWGGYLTLLAMGTQPDLWKCGIADAPVGDFEVAYEQASPFIKTYNHAQFGRDPNQRAKALKKASPMTYADSIRSPILLISGKHDRLCPLQSNMNFVERMQERRIRCEHIVHDGAHGFKVTKNNSNIMIQIIQFLDSVLV